MQDEEKMSVFDVSKGHFVWELDESLLVLLFECAFFVQTIRYIY